MIAKCRHCRAIYQWNGRPRLKDARCPLHGIELRLVKSNFQMLPVRREAPSSAPKSEGAAA